MRLNPLSVSDVREVKSIDFFSSDYLQGRTRNMTQKQKKKCRGIKQNFTQQYLTSCYVSPWCSG